jgi:hypothetical protein
MGAIMIENIDNFLDGLDPKKLSRGAAGADVGPKFKVARELWGRARRSEMINDAFEKAKNQASGFENGIVVQFRSILNNKKKARFFKKDELQAMRDVVRGTKATDLARFAWYRCWRSAGRPCRRCGCSCYRTGVEKACPATNPEEW